MFLEFWKIIYFYESIFCSPFNCEEIDVCLEYVQRLMETENFKETTIGIITPFKTQQLVIKNQLNYLRISNIEVGTVQTLQGLTKDVIIISTVRSNLLTHNGKEDIGFLSDKKVFNFQ